jgi:hypothetical protein
MRSATQAGAHGSLSRQQPVTHKSAINHTWASMETITRAVSKSKVKYIPNSYRQNAALTNNINKRQNIFYVRK